MIGLLNRAGLSAGLKLSSYHKVSLNFIHYLPRNTTSFIKRLPFERIMSTYPKPPSPKTIKLQTSDGVPLSYDIIYKSFDYHTISQYGSATLSALYIIFSGILMLKDFEDIFPDLLYGGLNLWISILFLYVNIGTAIISYKSPVRIYHNKETGDYKAIFNAFKPFNIRVIEFRKGMVEKIPPPDIVTLFRHYRYKIKGQDLYMFDTCFRYPADLYNMFDSIETEE